MIFTVLGAVAELERSLIRERVKAGLRNPRAKGKRIGRPKAVLDDPQVAFVRGRGLSWAAVAAKFGVGEGTVRPVALASAKNPASCTAASD
jgi:putative DNA-invertase from lambdoid prophage Rac